MRFAFFHKIILLIGFTLLIAGCAKQGTEINRIDNQFSLNTEKPKSLILVKFNYGHFGNTMYDFARVPLITMKPGIVETAILSGVVLSANKQKYDSYSFLLAEEIYNIFMKSAVGHQIECINFISLTEEKVKKYHFEYQHDFINDLGHQVFWKKMPTYEDKGFLSKLLEQNNASNALQINAIFGHSESIKKKMAIKINWIIFNNNGDPVMDVSTYYEGKQTDEIKPDTRNPKFEIDYLRIAQKCVDEFLGIIGKVCK